MPKRKPSREWELSSPFRPRGFLSPEDNEYLTNITNLQLEYAAMKLPVLGMEDIQAPDPGEDVKMKAEPQDKFDVTIIKQTTPLVQQIIETALQEADKQARRIIEEASSLASGLTRIVGIKINKEPVIKFKAPAHPGLPNLVKILKAGLLPLLVGPAGSGKSTLAETAAECLKLNFGHLCFSAGVSEVWLFGRHTPAGFKEAEFSRMYREGGMFLADELDAADPNVLLAINTALSSNRLYNPMSGETYTKHKDFLFIGAANTYGKGATGAYVGRNRLDAATLDRFVCLEIDYVGAIEASLCPDAALQHRLRQVRSRLQTDGSKEIVSYRSFHKAHILQSLGYKEKDILRTVFASFPEDLRARVL